MREELGQKRASLFVDSMDRWTQQGFALAKTPTDVRPKKSPRDLAIEPTTYPGSARKGAIQGREGHLEHPHEGRRAEVRGTGVRLR